MIETRFKILSDNMLETDDEIYHFEEYPYCLKLKNFDVYFKPFKHQDTLSQSMLKLLAEYDPE